MVNGSPEAVLLGWKLPLLSHLQAVTDRLQHDTLNERLMRHALALPSVYWAPRASSRRGVCIGNDRRRMSCRTGAAGRHAYRS